MTFVLPKLVLTPLLIASTSLAGRRWGALTSGWLLALPLTSGPIALFIALELGPAAGAQAAAGSLVGATAQVGFSLAYAAASRRELDWPACLALASAAFAIAAVVIPPLAPLLLFVIALMAVGLGVPFLRAAAPDTDLPPVARPSRWDIPSRAIVATLLVLAISGGAPLVGGHAAGILATFPIYVSVLTTFAHGLGGPSQARAVLRGLLLGLPGFATFFVVVALLVVPAGVVPAFGLALATAVALNVAILVLIVRRR
jgi:hypothetical protein